MFKKVESVGYRRDEIVLKDEISLIPQDRSRLPNSNEDLPQGWVSTKMWNLSNTVMKTEF